MSFSEKVRRTVQLSDAELAFEAEGFFGGSRRSRALEPADLHVSQRCRHLRSMILVALESIVGLWSNTSLQPTADAVAVSRIMDSSILSAFRELGLLGCG